MEPTITGSSIRLLFLKDQEHSLSTEGQTDCLAPGIPNLLALETLAIWPW